jgi:general stress protein 26
VVFRLHVTTAFTEHDVLSYMRRHKFAVIATTEATGAPHAVRVGIATTDALELVFDTLASTRKHANLQCEPRVAVMFTGPNQQTLEYEGVAFPVSVSDTADNEYREVYYSVWPDGRERAKLPYVAYWRIVPRWARYSEIYRGPILIECHWDPG